MKWPIIRSAGVGVVLLACTVGAVGIPQPPIAAPCWKVFSDTAGWRVLQSYSLGIEIRHPASYSRKFWESRSDSSTTSVDLRRDGRPIPSISLMPMTRLGAGHLVVSGQGTVRRCKVQTRSGPATLTLEETTRPIGPLEQVPLFIIRARLTSEDSTRDAVFYAISTDSSGFKEQIAILRTFRFLKLPGR